MCPRRGRFRHYCRRTGRRERGAHRGDEGGFWKGREARHSEPSSTLDQFVGSTGTPDLKGPDNLRNDRPGSTAGVRWARLPGARPTIWNDMGTQYLIIPSPTLLGNGMVSRYLGGAGPGRLSRTAVRAGVLPRWRSRIIPRGRNCRNKILDSWPRAIYVHGVFFLGRRTKCVPARAFFLLRQGFGGQARRVSDFENATRFDEKCILLFRGKSF